MHSSLRASTRQGRPRWTFRGRLFGALPARHVEDRLYATPLGSSNLLPFRYSLLTQLHEGQRERSAGPDRDGRRLCLSRYRNPFAVYNSDELDVDADGNDGNIFIVKDWLKEGKERLDKNREAIRYLCEPVPQPREVEQYQHYLCGDASDSNAL